MNPIHSKSHAPQFGGIYLLPNHREFRRSENAQLLKKYRPFRKMHPYSGEGHIADEAEQNTIRAYTALLREQGLPSSKKAVIGLAGIEYTTLTKWVILDKLRRNLIEWNVLQDPRHQSTQTTEYVPVLFTADKYGDHASKLLEIQASIKEYEEEYPAQSRDIHDPKRSELRGEKYREEKRLMEGALHGTITYDKKSNRVSLDTHA